MEARTAVPELIWGASAIARTIGRTDRQVFHLLEKGAIPAKRIGNRWVAERNQLMKFFTDPATDTKPAA